MTEGIGPGDPPDDEATVGARAAPTAPPVLPDEPAPRIASSDIAELERAYREVSARLPRKGALSSLDRRPGPSLVLRRDGVPAWWVERGNRFFSPPGFLIDIVAHPGIEPPRDAIVIVEEDCAIDWSHVVLWGDAPMVAIGPLCTFRSASFNCGGGSTVMVGERLSAMGTLTLNARNGGAIHVGPDNLWSTDIFVSTDDMHAILDAGSGRRVNKYGTTVEIGRHVWLGREVVVSPGATIGDDCVIGARAVVSGRVPEGCIAAGVPARVVREGITWSHEDTPPTAADGG